MKLVTWSYW